VSSFVIMIATDVWSSYEELQASTRECLDSACALCEAQCIWIMLCYDSNRIHAWLWRINLALRTNLYLMVRGPVSWQGQTRLFCNLVIMVSFVCKYLTLRVRRRIRLWAIKVWIGWLETEVASGGTVWKDASEDRTTHKSTYVQLSQSSLLTAAFQ
jgi:hypothetical protein